MITNLNREPAREGASMITSLKIHNFKCFADQVIQLAPLTLLVGANAAGKSSVIQALLLLRQSQIPGGLPEGKLLLNGRLASLGTALEVFSQWPVTDRTLGFTLQDDEARQFKATFDYPRGEAGLRTFQGVADGMDQPLNLFQSRFNYLNAERIGPRPLYSMPVDDRDPYDVGIHGEYAVHLVSSQTTLMANEALAISSEIKQEVLKTMFDQTQHWMRTIVPNFNYRVDAIQEADQVRVLFANVAGQEPVRPTNIGFGLIYTLPIVVAALVAPKDSMLIVENPEAHLHPASQSKMGRFLALVAAAGVQVIIETHSDHVLNGIRVAVRQKVLPADQVSIQYFASGESGGPPTVLTPRLFPSGGISPWPAGFFDQQDYDLVELL